MVEFVEELPRARKGSKLVGSQWFTEEDQQALKDNPMVWAIIRSNKDTDEPGSTIRAYAQTLRWRLRDINSGFSFATRKVDGVMFVFGRFEPEVED